MQPRLNFYAASPNAIKVMRNAEEFLAKSTIEKPLAELVRLRASQINGCAFCVDMHVKQASIRGERPLRLHHVTIWRESPLFNAREQAALEWTEALTRIAPHGVSDAIYARVRQQFTEGEIADLTFAIMAINAWNRANIAFRTVPGSIDRMYGLDKANLE